MLRLLALALLLTLPAVSAAQPTAPRRDRHGDPLPAGAIARLGTMRLRHSARVGWLAFSHDGKWLASTTYGISDVWDATTGRHLTRLPGSTGNTIAPFTPGEGTLTLVFDSTRVQSWDVKRGIKLRERNVPYGDFLAVSSGAKLAATQNQEGPVRVRDLNADTELFRVAAPAQGEQKHSWCLFSFSPNGKRLASGQTGSSGNPRVYQAHLRVWDVPSGKEVLRIDRPGASLNHLALRRDGDLLAVSEGNAVLLIDVASGRERRRLTAPGNFPAMFRFDATGARLAVGSSGLIDVYDVATGDRLQRLSVASARFLLSFALSPDGKRLAVGSEGNRIRLWDVDRGKEILVAPGPWSAIGEIAFAPDGKSVATAEIFGTVRLWRSETGEELRHFTRPPPVRDDDARPKIRAARLAFVDKGRTLTAAWDDGMIRVWDIATGKVRRQQDRTSESGQAVGFSSDGTLLAAVREDKSFRLEDVATGKVCRRFEPGKLPLARQPFPPFPPTAIAISPDQRSVAVGTGGDSFDSNVRLWETLSGRQRRVLPLDQIFGESGLVTKKILALSYSPDGRTLAIGTRNYLYLWDLNNDRERRRWRVQNIAAEQPGFAFSPDGKLLALGSANGRTIYDANPYFTLIDVATGDEVVRIENLRGATTALAFSPDGKTLAVGSADTTTTLWDVAHLLAMKRRGPLTAAELESLWSDLASADAERADRAGWALTRAAERAVPLLAARLRPVPVPDEQRLSKLVAAVGNVRLDVRRRAKAELEKLGDVAGPALQKALNRMPELETRQCLEQLIAKIEAPVSDGAELQRLRAVEVLERVGGPEARRALTALAAGAPGARLTREARAALRRAEAATSRAGAPARPRPAD